MRIYLALIGLVVVAGCASSDRDAAPVAEVQPKWDWPFETPAWAESADGAELAADEDAVPTVTLVCEFVDAGALSPLLADLLDVTPDRATLLKGKQADALREMIHRLDAAEVLAAPRIRVAADRAAQISVLEAMGGQRVYVQPTDVSAAGASVRFAAQIVYCKNYRQVDRERSWGTEGQPTLAVGEAVVCMGNSAESEFPILLILRLISAGE